jgi:hypothetical protein
MSWSANYSGHSSEFDELNLVAGAASKDQLDPRPKASIDACEDTIPRLLAALGDCHVSVSASGHTQPEAGGPGDSLSISIASVAEPESS